MPEIIVPIDPSGAQEMRRIARSARIDIETLGRALQYQDRHFRRMMACESRIPWCALELARRMLASGELHAHK